MRVKFAGLALAMMLVLGGFIFLPHISFLFSYESHKQELQELRAENKSLQAQLIVPSQTLGSAKITATVYSTYPFNNKNQITIAAGSADGIVEGAPVTIGGNALLGRISKVFPHYSTVQTVFDREWKLSVRIGTRDIDALMIGGQKIKLALVKKNARVYDHDSVYAAEKGIPYGLLVGNVDEVIESSTSVFQEAFVEAPYHINDIREVTVLNDY